ncbi:von Willebrand factor A domain-containing protein 2-like isoform X1 [Mercenaria mercenaria]|uniref:von Willebrand factor A domain-containing protein 2-like isoform X1 n=1 Tax=Mercenaria mercenaria TaxID=6596 RepID=UPI00234E7D66|nr:von Willebrand factor A domain-containing protein 2-like isoform X1 [Mercenaria mercenaria]
MCSVIKIVFLFMCLGFTVDSVSSTRNCQDASPADIAFIIDGSGSVTHDGFIKSLQFVQRIVDAFNIGPSATQVALIVFDDDARIEFYFNKCNDVTSLKSAISAVSYTDGGTDITAGIVKATEMFKDTSASGRRPSTTGIAILITDGQSYNFEQSTIAAEKLKDLGIIIYTAGVGNSVNVEELQNVATNSSYYFNADSYNSLEDINGPLTLSACTDIDGCVCYNGGTCTPGNFGNKCNCPAIYTGFYCEKPICDESPCVNGDCKVTGDNWFCSCHAGYTGTLCDSNIDECASNPCINGNCIDGVNKFRCFCQPGYTGTLCGIDIDECYSQPCQNKGTCMDDVNLYTCICAPGYTGINCAIEIDECGSSPCQNGATCLDWVNAFFCDCPPRYYGVYCETGVCQPSVADLVFVLDSSASQTKEEFGKQLDFINNFIDHIVLGEKNLQVGVITYSFEAVTEISIGQYNDNVTLKEAVSNIKYRPGATFTDKGLKAAKELFDSTSRNRPYGHFAKRYVFVLTDGMSTKRQATVKAAGNLKSSANKVLAIGIGKEVSHMELLAIASKESTATGRSYVYSVQNFNALYTVVKELVQLTCDECSWKTSSNIVFLLDMSPTMSADNFQTGLNAITYLTHKTAGMETENNTVRVALVTYGDGADTQLRRALNDSDTKQMFLSSIQRLVISDGNCQSDRHTCETSKLTDALKFADNSVFDNIVNKGDDSREIVIVLSDGQERITAEMNTELDKIKRVGRSVYALALGARANIGNLQDIVGDPALVFSVYDEFTINSLDALTAEFFFSSCDLTNDFLDGS